MELCDDEVVDFHDEVFTLIIDKVLVKKDDPATLVFCFTDGTEITQHIKEK